MMSLGLARLTDYQGPAYAGLYTQRLARVLEAEGESSTAVELRPTEGGQRYAPVLVMTKANFSSQIQAQVGAAVSAALQEARASRRELRRQVDPRHSAYTAREPLNFS